jgi:hypothetical protein
MVKESLEQQRQRYSRALAAHTYEQWNAARLAHERQLDEKDNKPNNVEQRPSQTDGRGQQIPPFFTR